MTLETRVDVLLADRYRLEERIAVGGMGEVWRAADTVLGRVVAVKTLRPEFVGDADFRARFRAEAQHSARLSHPGIAAVYDFGETPDAAWLVMELVDGEPLSSLLWRERVLPTDRVLDVVAQTAAALQAAHDGGVVHRDVKPGNLLVRPDGVVKVTDFGIASAAGSTPLTQTGQLVGTALYVSPEQASGRRAGPASDLYSLGVVAFECLSGARPFPGEHPVAVVLAHLNDPPPDLPSEVPPAVVALVQRLLAKDPADRPASAGELAVTARALRDRLAEGPDALLPVSPPVGARAATAGAPT
ncbi:MAG: serine/threonine protein kinase, partial [Frankiales bacterium]|nr:serine/threonine protein kinase [Frankiales bacterium]